MKIESISNEMVFAASKAGQMQEGAAGDGFFERVNRSLAEMNTSVLKSEEGLQAIAAGDLANLHQTMMLLEENRLSFQMIAQVRNKLIEGYQEVMKMQI